MQLFGTWRKALWAGAGVAALVVSMAAPAAAQVAVGGARSNVFTVTITNLTQGQSFTPILGVTHDDRASLFQAGAPASDELATMAEGGDIAPLADLLGGLPAVRDIQSTEGLLGPGESVSMTIRASSRARYLSVAAMLIPTNDAFFALNAGTLPRNGSKTYRVVAYDAGSEPNTEDCADIPGPVCGGEGGSPDAGGEGFVHVHNGIHGIADLSASVYDWRNPVAMIRVEAAN